MYKYQFEEVNEEHLSFILDIYNYYIENSTATFHAKCLTLPEMRDLVFFDTPVYKSFVIKCDSQVCGYILITQHKNREAYSGTAEVTVYLKPEWIGKGIGSISLKYMEEYAKKQGIHVLVATICGENEKSIRLFERNGYFKCAHYKEVGRKFGKFLDVVAYQKILQ